MESWETLVVQWLRLCASNAEGTVDLCLGTHGQKKKKWRVLCQLGFELTGAFQGKPHIPYFPKRIIFLLSGFGEVSSTVGEGDQPRWPCAIW